MSIVESNTTIADAFIVEFEQEMKTMRRFLERLPEDELTWRPHEKSMTAGQLAYHMASAPASIIKMALLEEKEVQDFNRENPQPKSVSEVLNAFDASVKLVLETLGTISDHQMKESWQLTRDGSVLLTMPRAALIRTVLLNHLYHHRGQFGVYLRLLGAIVPSAYGPSGDEMPDFLN